MAAGRARAASQAANHRIFGSKHASDPEPMDRRFCTRLRELGYVEERNVVIEYRWAEGHTERFAAFVTEFVRLRVDVIVTHGTAVPAAKAATAVIPIVFALANDPVGRGLVPSLARPGGNVTGLSLQSTDLTGKRLELLREVLPDFRRLAILDNIGFPGAALEAAEAQVAARALGMETVIFDIRRTEDIAPAFDLSRAARTRFISRATHS